jgi:arginine utilization protein RocB
MTKDVSIKKIDVEAELKQYDAEQAEKAKAQAEIDKEKRDAKMAELKRKVKINDQLINIVEEEAPEVIADILNALLPWVTNNLQNADLSLVNELIKRAGKKTKDSKDISQNLGRTYLVLDGIKFKSKHLDLYNSLIEKVGVTALQENKDQLVVTAKNYGPSFKKLVESKGFKAIPKSKGKKEVSATAVMLLEFCIAKKVVDDKTIDSLEVVKMTPLNYFNTPLLEG